MTAKTMTGGTRMLKFILKAKKDITNLSEVLQIDNTKTESFFIGIDGSCKTTVNLELSVLKFGISNRDADVKESKSQKLFVVPNPVQSKCTVLFDTDMDFEGNIIMYDMQGRTVSTIFHTFEPGRNIISIPDLEVLASGIYNITIIDAHGHHDVRMLKM